HLPPTHPALDGRHRLSARERLTRGALLAPRELAVAAVRRRGGSLVARHVQRRHDPGRRHVVDALAASAVHAAGVAHGTTIDPTTMPRMSSAAVAVELLRRIPSHPAAQQANHVLARCAYFGTTDSRR